MKVTDNKRLRRAAASAAASVFSNSQASYNLLLLNMMVLQNTSVILVGRYTYTATGYRVCSRRAFLLTMIALTCLSIQLSSGTIHDIIYDSNINIAVVVYVKDKAGPIDVTEHTEPASVTIVIPHKP
jgi:hypothetical protein